jgi:hypothetical protein
MATEAFLRKDSPDWLESALVHYRDRFSKRLSRHAAIFAEYRSGEISESECNFRTDSLNSQDALDMEEINALMGVVRVIASRNRDLVVRNA